MADPRFEKLQEEASEAVVSDDLVSIYVGLIHEEGENEYYFGNDTEDAAELRESAATQLGMMTRILADRSELPIPEVADLAAERAEEMRLR